MSEKFQPPRGTRDFLPEEMIKRQFVLDKIREVFELFGFNPLDTPAFESWELLSAKGGGGIKEDVYYFKDKSGRELGLRFDLTVPLARVVANNLQLPKPFKRYAMGKVWRYDRPSKGRFREFFQADVDAIGTDDMTADTEYIAIDVFVFRELGFKDFVVKINNRKVADGLIEISKIPKGKKNEVFRVIDKLEKIGEEEVKRELESLGITKEKITKLMEFVALKGKPRDMIKKGKRTLKDSRVGMQGLVELERVIEYADAYGVLDYVSVDFSIVRGLDYYTGTVYETYIKGFENIGSVCSGGRYDRLVEVAGGEPTPGVGLSFGVERIIEIMEEKGMFTLPKTKTRVFVANVNDKVRKDCLRIAQELRKAGINTQTDITGRNLRKQLEFIDSSSIPFALIVGPEEVKRGKFKLKDMRSGEEKDLDIEEIIKNLSG